MLCCKTVFQFHLPYFAILFHSACKTTIRQKFALCKWVNLFITESNQYSLMNAIFVHNYGQIGLENNHTNILSSGSIYIDRTLKLRMCNRKMHMKIFQRRQKNYINFVTIYLVHGI